jgi:hypothetical protein
MKKNTLPTLRAGSFRWEERDGNDNAAVGYGRADAEPERHVQGASRGQGGFHGTDEGI